MKRITWGGVVVVSLALAGCSDAMESSSTVPSSTVPGEASESTATASVAQAERSSVWDVTRVRGSGDGCQFVDADGRPADTFVLAVEEDLAIIFSNLGAQARTGPRGRMTRGQCDFEVPLIVPVGTYLAAWSQSLTYGIVKPAGVLAGFDLDEKLQGPRGANFNLPSLGKRFEKSAELVVALDVAYAQRELFPENQGRFKNWRKRWCDRSRETELSLSGNARVWAQRDRDGTEVLLAVSGLDTRVDLGATFEVCPGG